MATSDLRQPRPAEPRPPDPATLNPVPAARPSWTARLSLLQIVAFVAVTALVMGGLIGWVGASDVLGLLAKVGVGHLLAALLLTLTLPLVHAWRFHAVLAGIGYHIGARRAFDLTLAAWPVSSITPGKAGDLVKAYYLRRSVPASATAGTLLAERIIDVALLSGLSLLGSLAFQQLAITMFSGAILVAILGVFALSPLLGKLPVPDRWREKLDLLLASTLALLRLPRLFALTVGLTLLNCLTTFLVTAILYDGVGAHVPPLYLVAGLPPAMFAGLVPFTLAGMGTRDSVLILLFSDFATAAQSLGVGLFYALYFRWFLSLLGIPFLQRVMRQDARSQVESRASG